MNWQNALYLLPALISIGISAAIGFFALRRKAPGATSFGWMATLEAAWGLGYLFELTSAGLDAKVFWDNVQWIFTGLIPVAFLIFSLRYTGRVGSRPSRLYALLSIPTLFLTLLLATNSLHGLALQNARLIEQEPFSILVYDFTFTILGFSAYFYILMLAGIVYLLSYFVYAQGSLRVQISMILVGGGIPIAGTIFTLMGWIPDGFQRDISPYTFAAGNILMGLALFRYRMLQAVPLARNALFEQIREGMIVLDENAHVADVNPAAINMLGLEGVQIYGNSVFDVFQAWPHLIEQIRARAVGRSVLTVGVGQGSRQYAFSLSSLDDRLGRFVGYLITLQEMDGVSAEAVSDETVDRGDEQVDGYEEAVIKRNEKSNEAEPLLMRWLKRIFYPPLLKNLPIPAGREVSWYQSLERITTGLMRMSFLIVGLMTVLDRSVLADFLWVYRFHQVLVFVLGVLAVSRSISFSIRSLGFLLILYLFGVTETLVFGFTAEGFNAFLVVMVGAGILLLGRMRWMAFAVNVGTVLLFGFLIGRSHGLPLIGEDLNLLAYQVSRVDSSLLSFTGGVIGLGLATMLVWESASRVRRRERQTFNLLQQERDLLDRRVNERTQALAESEEKYRLLVEQLPVTVYRDQVSAAGVNSYFSPQVETLLGYSIKEWQDNPVLWHSLIYPADYAVAKRSISEVLENGFATVEYRMLHKNGSLVWVRDDAVLVRNADGEPLFVQGSMLNITEQKLDAQLRQEVEEMMSHVLKNLNEVFWVADARTGKDIYLSDAVGKVWGRSVDDMLNSPDAFLDSVFAADRPIAEDMLARQARGESVDAEYRIVRPDGAIRWIWDRSFPLPMEMAENQRVAGFSSDITELKQAQQEKEMLAKDYLDLFEQSPISLWEEDFSEVRQLLAGLPEAGVKDPAQYFDEHPEFVEACLKAVKIIKVNDATVRLYEAPNKEVLLGNFGRLFEGQQVHDFKLELFNIIQGNLHFDWITEELTLTGKRITVHTQWFVMPGYEADLSKVLVSVNDVTSQIEAHSVLRRQGEEYKALSQIAIDLLERRSLDQLLQTAIDQISFLLEAPFVEIILKEGDDLTVHGFAGAFTHFGKDSLSRQDAKLTRQAIETGKPVIIDNYSEYSERLARYEEFNLRSVAIFPILRGDECLGTLEVSRNQPGFVFSERQIQLGMWISHLLAVTLENTQLLETASLRASALNAAANAVLIADHEGVTEWVNPAFTHLTGYRFDEIVGKRSFAFMRREDVAPVFDEQVTAFVRDGKIWQGETLSQRKDGTGYIQDITVTPLANKDGVVSRFIAIMQDVTARKEMEKMLAESEQRYRSVVEAMSEGIVLQGVDGTIVTHNKAAEVILGLPHDQLIGRTSVDPRWRTVREDGTPFPGEEHPAMQTLKNGQPQLGVIMGVYKPDGTLAWISINSQPILDADLAGGAAAVVVTFTDITERKLAEERLQESEKTYRELINAMADTVWVLDFDATILDVNSAASRVLGYTRDELLSMKVLEIDGALPPTEILSLTETMPHDEVQHFVTTHIARDGRIIPVDIRSNLMPYKGKTAIVSIARDISDRVKAEEQLRASEERFRLVAQVTVHLIWDWDVDTDGVFWGEGLRASLGYSIDQLSQSHAWKLSQIHPDEREKVEASIRQSLDGGAEFWSKEYQFRRSDGTYADIFDRAYILRDATGRPYRVLGAMMDITERKQAEKLLLASEERYRLLYENMEDVVYQTDYRGVITIISPSVTQQAGYLPEEIVGKHASLFYVSPGELANLDNLIVSQGSVNDYEVRIKKKNGEFVYVSITVRTIFDKNGIPVGTEGIMRNIQERKEAEARILNMNAELEERVAVRTAELEQVNHYLTALLDTAVILNKNLNLDELLDRILLQARKIIPCRAANLMLIDGRQAYIARRQGGYFDLEALERNLMSNRFPLEWPSFERMLKTGEGIYINDTYTEASWQRVPSSEWVRSYIGVPLRVGNDIVGFLNFSHDQPNFFSEKDIQLIEAFANQASVAIQNSRLLDEITASLVKEKNLRDRLVQADKLAALGKMVAVIAHEINNPIQTVKNTFYLLQDEIPPNGMGKEYLAIASAEANRISNLVLQLREAYRPRSKSFEFVNIPDLLREIHALLVPQLKKSHVVCMQNNINQPCVVKGVRDSLKQVFINLSMNAIEAMAVNQGGAIVVDYIVRDDATIGIAMRNNGPLIPADALASIFDPFFTTKEAGGGLGLSIAFDIVKQHAGEITVDNDPDKGVTFTVWLPLAEKNSAESNGND